VADSSRDPGYSERAGVAYLTVQDVRRVIDLVASPSRPLTIFIDDLDRCSSETIVQTVETLNVFLAGDVANCNFLVAMDMEFVAAHLDARYEDVQKHSHLTTAIGWRFLEKVVQLPMAVPRMTPDDLSSLISTLTTTEAPDPAPSLAEAKTGLEEEPGAEGLLPASGLRSIEQLLFLELRDSDDRIAALLLEGARSALHRPRDVKRYINTFRLMAFVQRYRQRNALPAPDTPAHVAKIALLAVAWPELVSFLVQPATGPAAGQNNLAQLEATLPEMDEEASQHALREALRRAGVPEAWLQQLRIPALIEVLRSPPLVGPWTDVFL
jgi:hypothetical protein